MIEKMIETFKENFNEEIYGTGFAVITPLIIRRIFEHSDIFKLLNVEYMKDRRHSTPNLIYCGSYGFLHNTKFNKHNFHTERYMGLTSEHELANIIASEIVSRLELYILNRILENVEETYCANFKDDLEDISCDMYRDALKKTVITPKKLLNDGDLELLRTKYSFGNIVHLRDNIYVYEDIDNKDDIFNNMYISYKKRSKLCDYNPVHDVLIYRILKDEYKYEIYFNATFENFNDKIEITQEDTE